LNNKVGYFTSTWHTESNPAIISPVPNGRLVADQWFMFTVEIFCSFVKAGHVLLPNEMYSYELVIFSCSGLFFCFKHELATFFCSESAFKDSSKPIV
jgi:hypothetical protein